MFFKLVMPSIDPLMKGGIVGKWHKKEGEHVHYGDDLVDVHAEVMMTVLDRGTMEQRIRLLKDGGGSVRDEDLAGIASERALMLVARVTSSDAGILRRIEAKEGGYGEVGKVLAVLSSDDHGSADLRDDDDVRKASEFRVVVNLIG